MAPTSGDSFCASDAHQQRGHAAWHARARTQAASSCSSMRTAAQRASTTSKAPIGNKLLLQRARSSAARSAACRAHTQAACSRSKVCTSSPARSTARRARHGSMLLNRCAHQERGAQCSALGSRVKERLRRASRLPGREALQQLPGGVHALSAPHRPPVPRAARRACLNSSQAGSAHFCIYEAPACARGAAPWPPAHRPCIQAPACSCQAGLLSLPYASNAWPGCCISQARRGSGGVALSGDCSPQHTRLPLAARSTAVHAADRCTAHVFGAWHVSPARHRLRKA